MNFASSYEQVIDWIVLNCPTPDKFAHTYAGLTLWLLGALVLRTSLRSPWPLVVVFALEIANECVDRVSHGTWAWRDTIGDAAATWFWPSTIVLLMRLAPSLGR